METDRYTLIKEIFQTALERQPEERDDFLAAACAGDDELRRDVEALLAQQTENFLETPAIAKHAGLFDRSDLPVLKEGDLIEYYRIVSLLGRGGMGEVYLAQDTRFERKVALKILRGNWMHDPDRVQRFVQEARAASALNHPNIVTIHDIGQTGSIRFITTEFIDGQTLRQRLRIGRLDLREALDVSVQIAEALATAHAAGIVHRDIKPENVMLRSDGYIKVLDFGIAKRISAHEAAEESTKIESITATGVVLGTPSYMSPEQARGQKVDARTDIFSFGVTIYEMITGQPPFTGETLIDIAAAILTREQAPLEQTIPESPFELRRIVDKALRKKPDERYQTCGEMLAELKALQAWAKQSPPLPFTPETEEDSEELSPLLSEFDFSPRLKDSLLRNPQGGMIAFAAATGALIACLMSCFVGAACIRVTIQPECSAPPYELLFGYLAEFNAGFLYFVGVPVFVVTGFHLINMTHVMLRRLVYGKRLIVARDEKTLKGLNPLEIIRRHNRRLFHWLIPLFAIFAMVLVYGGEYLDRNKLAFGWVQALSVQDLSGKDLRQIRRDKKIGEIPVLSKFEAEHPNCAIQISNVTGGHGKEDSARWVFPFLVFIAVALGLQVAFLVFVLWLVSKTLFLFVLLCYALLDRPRQTFKIILDFEDEKKRFGLSALDVMHNALLTIILCASFVVLLQQITNVAKGTSFFSGGARPSVAGQALLFFASLLALFLLLVLPVLIFKRLIETAVGRHLERIDREEAELRKTMARGYPAMPDRRVEEALKNLKYKRELSQQQRPWPRENLIYRRLMLANIILLFVLLGNNYAGIFENATLLGKARGLTDRLCAFCSRS